MREYESDHGEDLYRRGLYTYWCRTFLHPSLLAFDAPTREECTAERNRSNTPTQALVLLNDPIYVEAARVFAEHIIRQSALPTDEPHLMAVLRRAHRSAAPRPRTSYKRSRYEILHWKSGRLLAVLRHESGRGAQAGRGGRVARAAGPRPGRAGGVDLDRAYDSESARNDFAVLNDERCRASCSTRPIACSRLAHARFAGGTLFLAPHRMRASATVGCQALASARRRICRRLRRGRPR